MSERQQHPMAPEHIEHDYADDSDECWECGGDGGWNSCMEDCCMAVGGEEGCDDPLCWRRCPSCKGTGYVFFGNHDGVERAP